ncbi:hypothetical protein SHDE107825_08470 [Shewanella denitrificans]
MVAALKLAVTQVNAINHVTVYPNKMTASLGGHFIGILSKNTIKSTIHRHKTGIHLASCIEINYA